MRKRICLRQGLLACVVLAITACSQVRKPDDQPYVPQVNQPGKDVVWWPTPELLIQKMLDMAKVTPRDFVIDLGAGDGRIVIAAARRGAHALGIEYDPDLVALSRRNIAAQGVGEKAEVVQGDIFQSDLSRATVITMFLLPRLNLKLRPTLLSLKPGSRVTSNTFDMDDWEPDESADLGCAQYCTAHLWIVPARVHGKWQVAQGELELRQDFQKVRGTLWDGNLALPLAQGRMHGEDLRFGVHGAEYRGRVHDGVIEGTVLSNGVTRFWRARRLD